MEFDRPLKMLRRRSKGAPQTVDADDFKVSDGSRSYEPGRPFQLLARSSRRTRTTACQKEKFDIAQGKKSELFTFVPAIRRSSHRPIPHRRGPPRPTNAAVRYGLNYLIDIENAVNVEATLARTFDEVAATKTMIDRTEACFALKPTRQTKLARS